MNDEDLVKRGEVKAFRQSFIYDGGYPDIKLVSAVTVEDIDCVPAVPRDMTASEYHLIKRRMCKNCPVCPLNAAAINLFIDCKRFEREYPEKAVALVENWAREHLEKERKDDAR